jgi:hypothetical protein
MAQNRCDSYLEYGGALIDSISICFIKRVKASLQDYAIGITDHCFALEVHCMAAIIDVLPLIGGIAIRLYDLRAASRDLFS